MKDYPFVSCNNGMLVVEYANGKKKFSVNPHKKGAEKKLTKFFKDNKINEVLTSSTVDYPYEEDVYEDVGYMIEYALKNANIKDER